MSAENQGTDIPMVNLSIDDKTVAVKAGSTIMDAAKKLGVRVPHFCWHPGLSVAGVCRLCAVKVEGNPKLQIACNTPVAEGMKVCTISDDVKQAQKWVLEFHLVNHPLDCPICDQAGECKLQDYYMEVGRYDSQVKEDKVLKPKALDVGRHLVLDTERCILCSRCVRFEDEITKTSSLGIFGRGDHATIGTVEGRRIEHNYSYNLADICPVGAFTSKDFRFKSRVWFLTHTDTTCPGCSTGCSVSLYWNRTQRQYYRLKPRFDAAVNDHWMCDEGRMMYEHLNPSVRAAQPLVRGERVSWEKGVAALVEFAAQQRNRGGWEKTALVLTPHYTVEEYVALLIAMGKVMPEHSPRLFIWRPEGEKIDEFDGILMRGDRNPNTAGLSQVLRERGLSATTLGSDMRELAEYCPQQTLILGPEFAASYPDFERSLQRLVELPQTVYFGVAQSETIKRFSFAFPVKAFAEKLGHYVNFSGKKRMLTPNSVVHVGTLGVDEIWSRVAERLS
jgi:NADH-quinone oxidoreductase subunit G